MIFIILLLGFAIRIVSLNQSLWLDEATTALVSKMPLGDIFRKFLPGDFHPPFYYVFMKGWVSLFGNSEISLRIPSVIFGIGVVFFVYLISKKLFGKKTALISSVLASTSGLLIYYSQEARMYMLVALLVSAAFYLFIEKKWVLFSVILVLIGLTDYIALFMIPIFLIFGRKDIKNVIKSLIPLVVVYLLWLGVFIKQLSGGIGVENSAWWGILGTLSWKNMALIPVKFILGRINFENRTLYALISVTSVLMYIRFIQQKLCRKNACKVIWGWLVIPILVGILVSIKIPVLTYFRFIFCLPPLYILAARGLSGFVGKRFWIALGIAIFMNIFFSGKYLLDSRYHRENWRGVASVVGENMVVYPANSQREGLIYYGKDGQIVYFRNFSGEEKEIWLSRYVWNIFDPNDEARVKVESLGYNKVQETSLNGVEFWKYEK